MANALSSISFLLTFAFVLVIFLPFSCDSAILSFSKGTRFWPPCQPRPEPPRNGAISCLIPFWKGEINCTASCRAGFKFPGGKTKLKSVCYENIDKWSPAYNFPECIAESKCRNKCQNGGVCQKNGNCECTRGFRGPFCEYCKWPITTTPTTIPSSLPTITPLQCVEGWSQLYNTTDPLQDEDGDFEIIEAIQERFQPCPGGTIEDIKCMTTIDGQNVDYTQSSDLDVKCDPSLGLVCLHDNQGHGSGKCRDYAVRLYCKCGPIATTPTTIPSTTPSIKAPSTTPSTIPLSLPAITPLQCVEGWSQIYNTTDPLQDKDGDFEIIEDIQERFQPCPGGAIEDIKCMTTIDGQNVDYTQSGDIDVRCDLRMGLVCLHRYQRYDIGKCRDYAVRLYCKCDLLKIWGI